MTCITASQPTPPARGNLSFSPKAHALALTVSILCAGVLISAFPQAIRASPSGNAGQSTFDFAISAGSLSNALLQFSETSGKRVLFNADLVRGLNSSGLYGRYSTEQALRQLLAGSGLTPRETGSGSVTLERAPKEPAPPPSGASTLGAVTVTGKAEYDSADPYNPDYSRPNAFTATKTDTPIMETPMSIQVVPQQVLKDQQVVTVEDAVKNVSSIQRDWGYGSLYDSFIIRGFASSSDYRNGFRLQNYAAETANVERIEVLKGPAAMLYGRVERGAWSIS